MLMKCNSKEPSIKRIKRANNQAYDFYFLKHHKKEFFSFIISLLFIIPTVLSVYRDCFANNDSLSLCSVLIVVFTIGNCAWTICQLKQEYNHIEGSPNEPLMKPISKVPDTIILSNEQIANGYIEVNNQPLVKGRGLYSSIINKQLIDNVYDVVFDNKAAESIRNVIDSQKNKFFKVLKYHKEESNVQSSAFFNESKLCLLDDIEKYDNKIYCHRGCYYDAFLTNICCTKQYHNATNMKIFFDGYSELFPINNANEITSISGSSLDNQIGISTIGLTNDNYLVIWVQNGHTQGDNMNASPSGSGSCDWLDRKHGQSFNEIIEYAMQRELWEESGNIKISKTVDGVGKTKLIGYFRWIEKGGKPEFLGVTKINCMRRQLMPSAKEVINPGFDGLHYNSPKELVALIEMLLLKCQYNTYSFSLPLYMNLKCLYDYLLIDDLEERTERIKWIFGVGN